MQLKNYINLQYYINYKIICKVVDDLNELFNLQYLKIFTEHTFDNEDEYNDYHD